MNASMSRLIEVSSAPLAPVTDLMRFERVLRRGSLGSELVEILSGKNGFFAFESALHVFPVTSDKSIIDIDRWNSDNLWKCEYGELTNGLFFFAEDVFGVQFCIANDSVSTFDPETGNVEFFSANVSQWCERVVKEKEEVTGYPLAKEWKQRFGPIPQGSRLIPRTPFVCGGKYEISNVVLVDAVKGMRIRGDIARQIHGKPDGTQIRFRVIE
jgi:hypothetical protein